MSHDDEDTASPRHGARKRAPVGLERPSLFADFDQNEVEDVEPQRVRLLSALESQRGRTPRPRSRRTPTQSRSPWATRGLMIAMGLGVLIVLISFIEVLRRPPPPKALPQTQTQRQLHAPSAATANATATAATQAATNSAMNAAAEIIEIDAPGAGSPARTNTVDAPATAAAPAPPVHKMLSTAAADVARLNADPSPPSSARPPSAKREGKESRDTRTRNDDVALLEAMFAHSGTRRAAANSATSTPSSTADALGQCGSASSADAAVCRARVCVQNPTAAACHGERP